VPRLSVTHVEPEEDPMIRLRYSAAVTLAAIALVTTTSGTMPADAADTSPPAGSPRIGLVVQDGAAAAPKFACVSYSQGMTGNDVLKAAQHQLTFDKSNFLSQIDGVPSTVKPFDAKHPAYWSYWHFASGKWGFSDKGGDTAKPNAGTVEGWFYVDGASYAPGTVSFDQVCSAPSPSTTPTAAATAKKSSSGSKAAVTVGIGVVVVLGAAAVVVSRRGRQH
jgi:hypothetical protein